VVGDLVLENTAGGAITVLNHPITGYSDGLFLAMAAAPDSWSACWWSGR
jgi:hypothetical protein